jgi:hypothetical protein
VSPYVIADAASSRYLYPGAPTDLEVMVYLDGILPVFSTRKALLEFARAQHPAEDSISPTPREVDQIRLMILVKEVSAVKWLVADPKISASGNWIIEREPVSVSTYRRYMMELASGVERLFSEWLQSRANPEDFITGAAITEVVEWIGLHTDKLDSDARARLREWEIEDDS